MKAVAIFYHSQSEADTLYYEMNALTVFLLELATLGFYSYWWFYQNWRLVKVNADSTISPVLRALFHSIFAYSLYSSIADNTADLKLEGHIVLRLLGVLHFFASVVLTGSFDDFSILQLIGVIFAGFDIVYVQYKINQINTKLTNISNTVYTRLDLLITVIILFEILIVYWVNS